MKTEQFLRVLNRKTKIGNKDVINNSFKTFTVIISTNRKTMKNGNSMKQMHAILYTTFKLKLYSCSF